MKIGIVGSGNVASVLAKLSVKNGHTVLQIMSRNPLHAQLLGDEIGCESSDLSGKPSPSVELFIVAISDAALGQPGFLKNLAGKLIVHTAGAVSKNILKEITSQYGVLYPLQSLRREGDIPDIPFLVDGSSDEVLKSIVEFARSLSSTIHIASDEERLKLHTSAVIVNNFSNHLYSLAEEFCEREQLDFKLLYPLIQESASRISKISPSKVQTGPAVRNDLITQSIHLDLLKDYPDLHSLYILFTESIRRFYEGEGSN